MRDFEYRGKNQCDDKWHYGYLVYVPADNSYKITQGKEISYFVQSTTIGQYTGFKDKNGTKMFEHDIVKFNNQIFEIVYEKGAFGLASIETIDYSTLEKDVEKETNNSYLGCYNDNFISLFEIAWNFNDCVDNCFDRIEVIGNMNDNPELFLRQSECTT